MKAVGKIFGLSLMLALCLTLLTGCGQRESVNEQAPDKSETVADTKEAEKAATEEIAEDEEDYTLGYGDTFTDDAQKASADTENADGAEEEDSEPEENQESDAKEEVDEHLVDLIFFMGQSNMSGCGGDASLAPKVAEDKGYEYRSVSDPTRLYPITEPFGINENRIGGLMEYPEGKKGSIVSAFINEYYELTKRKVVAVSISKGETSISDFLEPAVMDDVKQRYTYSKSYLSNNGYNIGHIYVVWLQGESDALEGTDPEVYKTKLDDFFRPMFIEGLEKVFFITPGRTYDYKNIYRPIINVQKQISRESGYYAMATTVLGGVSTEYMTDMYHYNQHVLNLVGIEAAKSIAYYTENGRKKIVYDYFEKENLVPDGIDEAAEIADEPLDLSKINYMY